MADSVATADAPCSGSASLNSMTQRRISDRLLTYALSNNYLILGSSEMNSVGWQVYRLNAYSPVKQAQTAKQYAAFAARTGSAKSNSIKGRVRLPANNCSGNARPSNAVNSANAQTQPLHNTNVQRCAKISDASRKCLLKRRRQMLSASTCTLRGPTRTVLRQRLKHARHRTLLTSYLQTSHQTDNVCACQLKCLLLHSDSWDFNVFHLDQYSLGRPVLHLALHLFNKHDLLREFSLDYRALIDTFKTIEDGYRPNIAYHNSVHAADVAQAVDCLMLDTPLAQHLTPFDKMTLLLSAFAHDVDHPGVNAPFLLKTNHFLSKLVPHSSSVLENHHWRTTAAIIAQTGLFKHFTKELYTKSIDRIRFLILATDIAKHQDYVTQFTEYLDMRRHAHMGTTSPSEADREFLMQVVIKLADICNPTRSWELCKHWSSRICIEFFQQGDLERQLGLPVTPRFDRSTTTVADTQIGFIDYVVRHSFALWHRFAATTLSEKLLENLEENRRMWDVAKVSQQKLLADENEAQMTRDTKENNAPTKENNAPPAISVNDGGDEGARLRRKPERTEKRLQAGPGSPVKQIRRDGDVYDETLAKYLNDRRHSLPGNAPANGGSVCVPRATLEVRKAVEQRRSSVPYVPVYGLNGITKPQGMQLRNASAAQRSARWNAKRWNLASSTEDLCIQEDDSRPALPVIQIDEVLCSVTSGADSIASDSVHDLAAQRTFKYGLTTKLSLQLTPGFRKKQSVISGVGTPLGDSLRCRRFSFPPSCTELLRAPSRGSIVTTRDGLVSVRKVRPKRSPHAAADIRRVKTVAKGDSQRPPLMPQNLLESSAAPSQPEISDLTDPNGDKLSRPTSPGSRRNSGKVFLEVTAASSSEDEDGDDRDREGDRLCLPNSPRHRSHSIEFDSARFVGGTLQYLASIGYDVVVAVPNLASGSACA